MEDKGLADIDENNGGKSLHVPSSNRHDVLPPVHLIGVHPHIPTKNALNVLHRAVLQSSRMNTQRLAVKPDRHSRLASETRNRQKGLDSNSEIGG